MGVLPRLPFLKANKKDNGMSIVMKIQIVFPSERFVFIGNVSLER